MTVTSDSSPFNETDFRAIEAAVLETEKGRWFLNEFGRRNRVADTQTLLGALGRLERNLTAQPASLAEEQPDLAALSSAISATCEDISSVRNDMLNGNAQIPEDKPVFAHLSETAHQIAVDLIATAEALQGTVNVLRKDSKGKTHADSIDVHVHSLFDEGWRQDILAQRVSKAMGLLEHLDQNLKVLASNHGAQTSGDSTSETSKAIPLALTEENLKFFDGDDDLFAKVEADQPDKTVANLEVFNVNADGSKPDESPAEQADVVTKPEETADAKCSSDEPEPVELSNSEAIAETETATNAKAENADQETTDEPAAEQASPAAPLKEPNIVVIKRGKSSEDTPEADASAVEEKETSSADSNDEETAVAPSKTVEKPTETVEKQEAEKTEVKSETKNLLADVEAKVQEVSGTDSEASVSDDTTNAFSDMAAEAPKTEGLEAESDKLSDNANVEDDERIVIIRHNSSDDSEIPFADYLGEDGTSQSKSDTAN